jgi:hypothetical protein
MRGLRGDGDELESDMEKVRKTRGALTGNEQMGLGRYRVPLV